MCVSLLPEAEKDIIKGLVKLLGGFYYRSMNRKCTHLIIPTASGEKYNAALRTGAKPVTREWLIEAVSKGGELFACLPS